MRKKYDIISENFELYFDSAMEGITQYQRGLMPKDLFYRAKFGKLNFIEKASILWKVFGKNFYVLVRDSEEGLYAKEIEMSVKEFKEKEFGEVETRDFIAKAYFSLIDDSVCRGLHYQALLSSGAMYKYVSKSRGVKAKEIASVMKGVVEVSRMLIYYEGKKKEMNRREGLTLAEWFILLYFSDGVKKKGSSIYETLRVDAFGCGKSRILSGLKRMVRDGFLLKTGSTKASEYQMSALGYDKLYTCLSQYVLNY